MASGKQVHIEEGICASTNFHLVHILVSISTIRCSLATSLPAKLALYATAFSRYAPLNVEPLKSDSLISADVKLALLYKPFRLIINTRLRTQSKVETSTESNKGQQD